MAIKEANWKWFGNAGHFICAQWCQFHLCTKVGKYLVSTVGQYVPDEKVGYQDIGCDRKYETMVFLAGKPCASKECGCGLPSISGSELDYAPANDPKTAKDNHMKLCRKWARRGRRLVKALFAAEQVLREAGVR